jgi:D-amino acid aminotransferase
MGEIAYVDGKLVPLAEARISIFDRGFLYGDGLFETIRVYEKTPFLLEKHLKRLLSSAKALKINCPHFDELESIAVSVLQTNSIDNGVLKIILTRGVGERGLSFSEGGKPTLIMTLTEGIPYTEDMYRQGFSAVFVPEARSFGYLKSLNFLANVVAKSFADSRGAQEAFFVRDDFVTEGTMSNIFAIREGKLVTPSLDHKILPGITREQVLNLTNDLGIDFCEGSLLREELEESDEVFITNSILEIMPVIKIEEKKIGSGVPGEITSMLREKYKGSISQYLSKGD